MLSFVKFSTCIIPTNFYYIGLNNMCRKILLLIIIIIIIINFFIINNI